MLAGLLGGAVAGGIHALAGPDHLAAITPAAAHAGRNAWRKGLAWGGGHACSTLLIGLAATALRPLLPLASIAGWSERIVGLVLVVLGCWGLLADRWRHRRERHAHGAHRGSAPVCFVIGLIHGAAGGPHLLGVIPAALLPTLHQALLYLLAFGVGALGGMMLWAQLLGWLSTRLPARGSRTLLLTSYAIAVLVGTIWLSSTG